VTTSSKKLLVFLRAYNDIDHITPILYKWLTITDIPVDIVITTEKHLLYDYRIEFLKTFQNLTVHFIDDFLSKAEQKLKRIGEIVDKGYSLRKYNPIRMGLSIFKRIFKRDISKEILKKFNNKSIERIFEATIGNVTNRIVIFDWTYTNYVKKVIKAAKDRGIKTISLPHGDWGFSNLMVSLNDINYSCIGSSPPDGTFDYIIYANRPCAMNYERDIDSGRVKLLGSARYSDEWLNIISGLTPKYSNDKSHDKLKIVLFLRNFNYPIFWDEVIRTIKLINQFTGVYLVVQHHTRSDTVKYLVRNYPDLNTNAPNLEFVFDDVHSVSLLKWADIALDLGTSVVYEAVKRKIPVLSMEYLHAYRSNIAHYMESCDIKCRDDLYNLIQTFLKDGTANFYDETERKQFIQDIIDVPDNNILDRYVAFFKSCL